MAHTLFNFFNFFINPAKAALVAHRFPEKLMQKN